MLMETNTGIGRGYSQLVRRKGLYLAAWIIRVNQYQLNSISVYEPFLVVLMKNNGGVGQGYFQLEIGNVYIYQN